MRLLRTWSGVIAWTDDVSPILGESRDVPGLYTIVVGSSGYTLSPLFARMLAEQIDRRRDPPAGVLPRAKDTGMNRDTVDWRGYFAAVPTPFNEDGSLALDLLRELLEFYVGAGPARRARQRHDRRVVLAVHRGAPLVAETAIDAIGGRIPVLIGCTDYTADLVIAHARHAFDAGAPASPRRRRPTAKPFDDEIVAFYEDIARGASGRPADDLQLGPRHERRDRHRARRAAGRDRHRRRVQGLDAERRAVLRQLARRQRPRAGVRAVHVGRGYEQLRAYGGDGTIGGGSLWGRPDPEFWEAHWRGDEAAALAHARRTEELFPKLWLPGGWAGMHGHYASELKALMKLLGQPGGDGAAPAAADHRSGGAGGDAAILAEAGLLVRRMRLPLGPGLARGPAVTLTLDGRAVTAHDGETVATVLIAEGLAATRTTSTASRAASSAAWACASTASSSSTASPNTRACMTPVAEGW